MDVIQTIGAYGAAITAALIWFTGIAVGIVALGQSLIGDRSFSGYYNRDWPVIALRFMMLLIWLAVGFLIATQIKT